MDIFFLPFFIFGEIINLKLNLTYLQCCPLEIKIIFRSFDNFLYHFYFNSISLKIENFFSDNNVFLFTKNVKGKKVPFK